MNWKTDLKLADLDATTSLEITCKRCGLVHYQTQARLMQHGNLRHAYLDQVEATLTCTDRMCKGHVRVSLVYDDKMEGFVGGMA